MRRSKTTGESTTNYLYDRISTIGETDGAGQTIADYTNNPTALVCQITSRTDTTDAATFYSYDGLGSTGNMTDITQNQISGYSYDAFGNVLDHTGQDATYTFSTKEQDATGLYYFAARYYDPEIGRFITQDPYPANLFDPQSLNRYVYCENDPINYVDPFGLKQEKCPNSLERQMALWAYLSPPWLTTKGYYALASYFLIIAGPVMIIGACSYAGPWGTLLGVVLAVPMVTGGVYNWQENVSSRAGPYTIFGF